MGRHHRRGALHKRRIGERLKQRQAPSDGLARKNRAATYGVMCGRFTRRYSRRELWELYTLKGGLLTSNVQPRYNVCPTTTIDATLKSFAFRRVLTPQLKERSNISPAKQCSRCTSTRVDVHQNSILSSVTWKPDIAVVRRSLTSPSIKSKSTRHYKRLT